MSDRQRALSLISRDKGLTPFQRAVYRAVLAIPPGEVRSYAWVARRAGRPRAARAAGNALRANPYTIVIPCHRVVRSDGALGGYSKGCRRKRLLLAAEGVDAGGSRLL